MGLKDLQDAVIKGVDLEMVRVLGECKAILKELKRSEDMPSSMIQKYGKRIWKTQTLKEAKKLKNELTKMLFYMEGESFKSLSKLEKGDRMNRMGRGAKLAVQAVGSNMGAVDDQEKFGRSMQAPELLYDAVAEGLKRLRERRARKKMLDLEKAVAVHKKMRTIQEILDGMNLDQDVLDAIAEVGGSRNGLIRSLNRYKPGERAEVIRDIKDGVRATVAVNRIHRRHLRR